MISVTRRERGRGGESQQKGGYLFPRGGRGGEAWRRRPPARIRLGTAAGVAVGDSVIKITVEGERSGGRSGRREERGAGLSSWCVGPRPSVHRIPRLLCGRGVGRVAIGFGGGGGVRKARMRRRGSTEGLIKGWRPQGRRCWRRTGGPASRPLSCCKSYMQWLQHFQLCGRTGSLVIPFPCNRV
ncbi:hypothetical protein SETIT_5G412400v2 [Setaria italica]|uniref:Uncharacterized protein n=1 Tax=Setaria italica TaxID=4555 RepID=A0A368RG48_SETIT|nr:hypothetical protein SETIT_5G412400v2 [Setaria italica]